MKLDIVERIPLFRHPLAKLTPGQTKKDKHGFASFVGSDEWQTSTLGNSTSHFSQVSVFVFKFEINKFQNPSFKIGSI